MLLRAFGAGLLVACASGAFAEPVTNGDIRAGSVTGTIGAGSAITTNGVLGLAGGSLTAGRIISGTASGTFDPSDKTFKGDITDAVIEDASVSDPEVNQVDAAGKVTHPKSAALAKVRLEKATIKNATVTGSFVSLGAAGSRPAPNISWEGDYVILGVAISEFNVVNDANKRITIPAGTKLKVGKETQRDNATYVPVSVVEKGCRWFYKARIPLFDPFYPNANKCSEAVVDTSDACKRAPGNTDGKVCAGWPYEIKKDVLNAYDHDRFGLTYGMMVVPIKAYLGDNRTITTGATVGPYLGYESDSPGTTGIWAVGAGLTSIPVQHEQNGQTVTQTETGISIALGFMGRVKDSFNMGLFLGWDLLNKPSDYKYNGKPWVGLQFAYALSK